jgi:hypothetical protein
LQANIKVAHALSVQQRWYMIPPARL